MAQRTYGNPPLLSTTAPFGTDPSTATLCAELIIPTTGDTSVFGYYDVRFGLGASTGALWRLDCAASSALSSAAVRDTAEGADQRINIFTGSNLSGEFVVTWRAKKGDRFRVVAESSFTGTYATWIQAEALS